MFEFILILLGITTIRSSQNRDLKVTNPYESTPVTGVSDRPLSLRRSHQIGPFLVAFLFIAAALLGVVSIFIPSIRAAIMPRFGWIGLICCLNPLIFLLQWFRRPTRRALMGSALMTFSSGAINAVQLIFTGTVSIVVNEFSDRLHSSWFWSVIFFFVVGLYLCLISLRTPWDSNKAIADEIQ